MYEQQHLCCHYARVFWVCFKSASKKQSCRRLWLLTHDSRDANPAHDSLAPFLLRNHENDDGICLDFFEEAVSRIPEDDTIEPIFTEAMVQLSQRLATMTMNDDYKPYVNVRI